MLAVPDFEYSGSHILTLSNEGINILLAREQPTCSNLLWKRSGKMWLNFAWMSKAIDANSGFGTGHLAPSGCHWLWNICSNPGWWCGPRACNVPPLRLCYGIPETFPSQPFPTCPGKGKSKHGFREYSVKDSLWPRTGRKRIWRGDKFLQILCHNRDAPLPSLCWDLP